MFQIVLQNSACVYLLKQKSKVCPTGNNVQETDILSKWIKLLPHYL